VAAVPGVPLVRIPVHDAAGRGLAELVGGDLP
jgi:hypothetical protein